MQPMTIAYVGNFNQSWHTENHIAAALRVNGHEVVQLDEIAMSTWRALLNPPEEWGLVLWTSSRLENVPPGAVRQGLGGARKCGLSVVGYHLDRWWGLGRQAQIATSPFFKVDVLCTPDGGNDDRWVAAGVNHWWFPPAVHLPDTVMPERPSPRFSEIPPIAFVGGWQRYHPEWPHRLRMVEHLRKRWGDLVGFWPGEGEQRIHGPDLTTLYHSARVVVGDSCDPEGRGFYWSDRVPWVLGCGGYLVHSEVQGLDEAMRYGFADFPVGDFAALDRCIAWALDVDNADDRAEIVEIGRDRVLAHDTYTHRMAAMMQRLEDEDRLRTFRRRDGLITATARHGVTAKFKVRSNSTDGVILDECWREDQYQLHPNQVQGGVVVDVGANIGAFTIWAAAAGARRVDAYEPAESIREQLQQNLALNPRVAPAVRVYSEAMWRPCDYLGIKVLDGYEGGTRTNESGIGQDVVMVKTLGEIIDRAGGHLKFLKIDCEGCEYPALAAASGDDLQRVDQLVMEFHGPRMPHMTDLAPGSFGKLIEFLAEWGVPVIHGRPSTGGVVHWTRHGYA